MAEHYLALNRKYLEEGDRLLEIGDYVQASEKYWGAMAEMLKAVAHRRGLRHWTHRELGTAVSELSKATGDRELVRLFSVGESLHANFYEDFMGRDTLNLLVQDVREFIEKLREI